MNKYVIVTVDAVFKHEISEGEDSIFPQPYDLRMVEDEKSELIHQLEIIECHRSNGYVSCYEISSYDRFDPESGWVIESYDQYGNPYQIVKCIKA